MDIFSFGVASDINISSFTAEPYVEYPNYNLNYIFLHKEKELLFFYIKKRGKAALINGVFDFKAKVKSKSNQLHVSVCVCI